MSAIREIVRDSHAEYVASAGMDEILGYMDRPVARRGLFSACEFWLGMDVLAGRYEQAGLRIARGILPSFEQWEQIDGEMIGATPSLDRMLRLIDGQERLREAGAQIGPLVLGTAVNSRGLGLWLPRDEEEELTDAELNRRLLFVGVRDMEANLGFGNPTGSIDSIVRLYESNIELLENQRFETEDRELITQMLGYRALAGN